jgi:hypothetical protein
MMKKGYIQTDYIIALGIFIFLFGLSVFYVTNYLYQIRESAKTVTISKTAASLMTIADSGAIPGYWPEIEVSGPLHLLFHFSENSSTVRDYSGHGNAGAANGSIFNASGKFGSGMSFSAGHVKVESPSLNITGAVTLEAWMLLHSNDSVQTIMAKGNERLELQAGSRIRCIPTNGVYLEVQGATGTGKWTHVACVYDPSSAIAKVYIDGDDAGAANVGPNPTYTPIAADSQALFIGSRPDLTQNVNGTLDEIAIFNSSLSAEDIKNHAQFERKIQRLGLGTKVYRFLVNVNNSKPFWYNQSANHTDLSSEIISVDLSSVLPGKKFETSSASVFSPSGSEVQHNISDNTVSFTASVGANGTLWYSVYVAEDGIFPDRSVELSGSDSMSETVMPPEEISAVGSVKLADLAASNYTRLSSALEAGDFRIKLYDINSGTDYFSYGGSVPKKGNVAALQRYVLYQNSTGGLRPGRMTVQSW